MIDIYKQYQLMEKDAIILSFKGDITQDLLTSVYQIMESRLDTEEENTKLKKKFFHILVECLQNVYHHKESLKDVLLLPEQDTTSAIFMVTRESESSYRIITGNHILTANADELKSRLDKISTMNADQLRQHYLETLSTTELSDKGGAGLGMIDIARKSGHKLDYKFDRISDDYSFFSLGVVIK